MVAHGGHSINVWWSMPVGTAPHTELGSQSHVPFRHPQMPHSWSRAGYTVGAQ